MSEETLHGIYVVRGQCWTRWFGDSEGRLRSFAEFINVGVL